MARLIQVLTIFLVLSAAVCWASPSACALQTLSTSNGGPGCTQTDLLFGGTAPYFTASTTVLTGTPLLSSVFDLNTTTSSQGTEDPTATGVNAVSLEFLPPTGGGGFYGANANGSPATMTMDFNFDVQSSGGLVIDGFYFQVASFFLLGTTPSGTVTESVCLTAPGCLSPFQTPFSAGGSLDTSFGGPTSSDVFVNVHAFVNLPASDSELAFPEFIVGFDQETPEPSTILLVGTALAGVAFLRHRQRPKA